MPHNGRDRGQGLMSSILQKSRKNNFFLSTFEKVICIKHYAGSFNDSSTRSIIRGK
jgi:hypothetical protein